VKQSDMTGENEILNVVLAHRSKKCVDLIVPGIPPLAVDAKRSGPLAAEKIEV